MFRSWSPVRLVHICFPHASGDVPCPHGAARHPAAFSPRKWGCSVHRIAVIAVADVFPTQVGMFRESRDYAKFAERFPHASGDVPAGKDLVAANAKFSPRKWGCSASGGNAQPSDGVSPTQVGMFRVSARSGSENIRFPHASGDVPAWFEQSADGKVFSPRKWGCSERSLPSSHRQGVFPTQVGMFRGESDGVYIVFGFPHASGDVPVGSVPQPNRVAFSPRKWGCSVGIDAAEKTLPVFPTQVGMFRRAHMSRSRASSFPHASGDVPYLGRGGVPSLVVFPTQVGMFRSPRPPPPRTPRFPHASGDVPCMTTRSQTGWMFSPRKWGCSE